MFDVSRIANQEVVKFSGTLRVIGENVPYGELGISRLRNNPEITEFVGLFRYENGPDIPRMTPFSAAC